MGNDELSAKERAIWREADRIAALPPEQLLPAFVANQLAAGVEPPPPPPGPRPPWMASRPAGLRTLIETFRTGRLDLDRLRAFDKPVLFALGGKSNPDYYGRMAERATTIFPDMTLEVFGSDTTSTLRTGSSPSARRRCCEPSGSARAAERSPSPEFEDFDRGAVERLAFAAETHWSEEGLHGWCSATQLRLAR